MPSPKTVVLISIDGMRPDALQMADTPTMDRLIADGAVSWAAESVMPSVTLPCHTSMLRGVEVSRHGITTNTFHPIARPVPSVIDVAHAAGKRTGFFFNWGQLRDLSEPYSLDVSYLVKDCKRAEGDWRVARAAACHAEEDPFDLLFAYLGYTDECGHKHGWMTDEYLGAIANADRCIKHILGGCRRGGREPVVMVVSDHGGHGRAHGDDIPEDMTIPWLLSGPGICTGLRIDRPVRIYDTCPTLAALLGLPADPEWDGRAVEEAFQGTARTETS